MTQNGRLTPNLDEKNTKMLNLSVLQRIDPFVEEILITAAHVTFYEFNIDTSQWSRKCGSDVPYGDYFIVEGRWDVERDGDDSQPGCILRIYINVSFLRKPCGEVGADIVKRALSYPLKLIANNAIVNGSVVCETL